MKKTLGRFLILLVLLIALPVCALASEDAVTFQVNPYGEVAEYSAATGTKLLDWAEDELGLGVDSYIYGYRLTRNGVDTLVKENIVIEDGDLYTLLWWLEHDSGYLCIFNDMDAAEVPDHTDYTFLGYNTVSNVVHKVNGKDYSFDVSYPFCQIGDCFELYDDLKYYAYVYADGEEINPTGALPLKHTIFTVINAIPFQVIDDSGLVTYYAAPGLTLLEYFPYSDCGYRLTRNGVDTVLTEDIVIEEGDLYTMLWSRWTNGTVAVLADVDAADLPEAEHYELYPLAKVINIVHTVNGTEHTFEVTADSSTIHDAFAKHGLLPKNGKLYVNGEAVDTSAMLPFKPTAFTFPSYSVSFNANGGTGEMAAETDLNDAEYTLPECGFTAPEGMQFKGWAYSAAGEVIASETITLDKDVELFAIWQSTACTITFDANGGMGVMTAVKVQPGQYTLPECSFIAPEGTVFAAWLINNKAFQPGDVIDVTADTLVKAAWTAAVPGAPDGSSSTPAVPQTGDSTQLGLWICLMTLSLLGLCLTSRKRKIN